MYEYTCTIRRVVDGDTVDVDIDLGFDVVLSNQRIRLYGIDTPESRTRDLEEKKYGKAAARFLESQITTGTVTLRTHLDGRGKFGRILGEFIVYDGESDSYRSVNKIMVEKHLATEYYGQSKDEIEENHIRNRQLVDPIFLKE